MFCPICGTLARTNTPVIRPDDAGPKTYQVCWCTACDARFDQRIASVNMQADTEHQAQVNQDFYAQGFEQADYDERIAVNQVMMQNLVRFCVDRALFVEIGVGLGFLSRAVAPQFTRVVGLDLEVRTALSVGPVPANVEFHPHQSFLDSDTSPISALCAWHVVEHLPNPHIVLEPLFGRMRSGAVFCGQIPLYREDYVFDSHFIWYTEQTLICLTRSYGFVPVYTERDETNGFLSFLFRKL